MSNTISEKLKATTKNPKVGKDDVQTMYEQVLIYKINQNYSH